MTDSNFKSISEQLAKLSPAKRALLELYLKEQAGKTQTPKQTQTLPQIKPNYQDKYLPFPLNDIQEAYWVGRTSNVELGNVSTHSYLEVDTVNLDLVKFEQAWQKLIERHDALRTKILPDGTQQVLEKIPAYKIKVLDLKNQPVSIIKSELMKIREEQSHEVLPCDRPPLFNITATKLGEGKIRLHFSYDALILDGWSVKILFQEWYELYHHPETKLPPLEISFRDYILALKSLQKSDKYEKAKNYWLQRIETLPPAPQLPLTKQLANITKPKFEVINNSLNQVSWSKLKTKAAKHGITPSAILLTAFAEILRLWSKKPQFTINLTYLARLPLHPQVNNILGDFTSIVLLAIENESQPNFLEKAKKLQKQLWSDLQNNIFTGVQVLRKLAQKKQISPKALMPVVFTSTLAYSNQENSNIPQIWMGEQVCRIFQTPQVWLDNIVSEVDGELHYRWNFVAELFPEGMIEEMFTTYHQLLQKLATDEEEIWQESSLKIKQNLLSTQKLNGVNQITNSTLLHELFAQQVANNGEQIAIIAPNYQLTYKQLFIKANKIAHHLHKLGVKPNELIAVVMEKGWEQIVAVLGILGSGAAYLPIEAELGKDRIEYILKQGKVKYVLTQSWLENSCSNYPDIQDFAVDKEQIWTNYPSDFIIRQTASDLAYVIYTSGSTGKPKGVMINHQGAVNTILDINERFQVKATDKILALSSLSFDLSVYDIFGILAAGGTIVIPEAEKLKDTSHWVSLIIKENITIWNSVPILIKLLVEYINANAGLKLPSLRLTLRLTLLSGDWLPVTLPKDIKKIAPKTEIISLGGGTEASIWSILYAIGEVNPNWKTIPYGKAMKNQQVYVLNQDLISCPTWVKGDIYIGGIGLSNGYWEGASKTAKSFINHPLTQEKLYRTGDKGRYLPDGNIEFLGREDFQVKIQGNRIELTEIEVNLKQHPLVKLAVVNAVGEEEKRLIAYVTLTETTADNEKIPAKLAQFLQQKLPNYMIPHSFVILAEFPLTPNGKINRQALPIPQEKQPIYQSPSASTAATQITKKITEIVAEILKITEIKINSNWLSLGATSVDMIRIANRLEETFKIRPSFDELYTQPTAREIAEIITAKSTPQTIINQAPSPQLEYSLIKDPEARNNFKNQQLGLRQDLELLSLNWSQPNQTELAQEYQQRATVRQFSQETISLTNFSQFLSHLSQIQLNSQTRYLYPSAGSLYPLQIYLHIKPHRLENIEGGIYYYHPLKHDLAQLSPTKELDATIHERLVNRPVYETAAFSIFLLAQMKAIVPMYGENARDFCLIEAGCMVQLMMMKAKQYQLGLCAIGKVQFEKIKGFFQLDEGHLLIHSLLGGKLLASQENLEGINTHYDFNSLSESETESSMSMDNDREEFEI